MPNFRNCSKGQYIIKHPEKYIGKHPPTWRSGWELQFMSYLDNNPHFIKWASESIAIPYRHPLTGKIRRYIPDFFVMYADAKNKVHAEILEIKPASQTSLMEATSRYDKLSAIINQAKWKSAMAYCHMNGYTFRILTEHDLFINTTVKQKRPQKQRVPKKVVRKK